MVELNKNIEEIKEFLKTSIERFESENGKPKTIGIYCCPWSGWISTNFNLEITSEETGNNCPDFEIEEFDFLELNTWREEYETGTPTFKINEQVKIIDTANESINKLIFDFLKPIVIELKENYETEYLLQMLDSRMVEVM